MPFTFAHIGYILPIKKKWSNYFSITGLIFGSLAPDFDILFRLTKIRFHIFQYDLKTICFLIYPIAFISAVSFHLFCRNILIQNLPSSLYEKYKKHLDFNFINYLKKHFLTFTASVFFAIFLHLILDFFCHCINAYSVNQFFQPLHQKVFITNIINQLSIYLLPILFSLFGFYWIYKFEFESTFPILHFHKPKEQLTFWFLLFFVTAIISIIKIIFTEKESNFWIDLIAISITSSLIIAIYICCFLVFIYQKRKFKKLVIR